MCCSCASDDVRECPKETVAIRLDTNHLVWCSQTHSMTTRCNTVGLHIPQVQSLAGPLLPLFLRRSYLCASVSDAHLALSRAFLFCRLSAVVVFLSFILYRNNLLSDCSNFKLRMRDVRRHNSKCSTLLTRKWFPSRLGYSIHS